MPAQDNSDLQAVLLDLDGTLVDTATDLCIAINLLLREAQRPDCDIDKIRPLVSQGSRSMISELFAIPMQNPDLDVLCERFLIHYRNHIAETSRLFSGMHETLDGIENMQLKWGIVTNKIASFSEPLITALDLHERTHCLVSGDTTTHSKPHPEPLLYACKLLHCKPSQTLYIGDAKTDIIAGKAAGMLTMVASYGYIDPADNIETWGATGEIVQPLMLLDWLRKYHDR